MGKQYQSEERSSFHTLRVGISIRKKRVFKLRPIGITEPAQWRTKKFGRSVDEQRITGTDLGIFHFACLETPPHIQLHCGIAHRHFECQKYPLRFFRQPMAYFRNIWKQTFQRFYQMTHRQSISGERRPNYFLFVIFIFPILKIGSKDRYSVPKIGNYVLF